MNDYEYLFKFIMIGDSSNHRFKARCGQVVPADEASRRQIQESTRAHSRG